MDVRVGRHGGAHVDADGGCVNQLDVRDALGADLPNMGGQGGPGDAGFQRGDEAFQHHGGFARTRNAGYDGQPSLGNVDFEGLYCVNACGGQANRSLAEHFIARGVGTQVGFGLAG